MWTLQTAMDDVSDWAVNDSSDAAGHCLAVVRQYQIKRRRRASVRPLRITKLHAFVLRHTFRLRCAAGCASGGANDQGHGRAIARPVERLVVPDSEPDRPQKKVGKK